MRWPARRSPSTHRGEVSMWLWRSAAGTWRSNAAAALACAGAVGADLAAGAAALADVGLTAMRMQVERISVRCGDPQRFLQRQPDVDARRDRRAWSTSRHAPRRRRRVMAEISDAEAEHRAIAVYAADRGVELIAVGTDLYGVAPVGRRGDGARLTRRRRRRTRQRQSCGRSRAARCPPGSRLTRRS